MKDTENRLRVPLATRREGDADGQLADPSFPPLSGAQDYYGSGPALPRSAQWGQKGGTSQPTHSTTSLPSSGRLTKSARTRNGPLNLTRNVDTLRLSHSRSHGFDKKSASYFSNSTSRPSTPGVASLPPKPAGASESLEGISDGPASTSPVPMSKKPARDRSSPPHSSKPRLMDKVSIAAEAKIIPTQATTTGSEFDAIANAPSEVVPSLRPADGHAQDTRSESVPPLSPSSTAADSVSSNFTPPPPPGLVLPPAQSTYQLSNQAKALMEDVLNRRQSVVSEGFESPFPDFDRTLSNLGDGSFSFDFTLDPKMATKLQEPSSEPKVNSGAFDPFGLEAKPSSGHTPMPSGSPYRPPSSTSSFANSSRSSIPDPDSRSKPSSYAGSFNPFSEASHQSPVMHPQPSPLDDDPLRRGSKFGFARKDQSTPLNGFSGSATSSPLRYTDALPTTPLYSSTNGISPKLNHQQSQSWMYQQRQREFNQSQQQTLPPPPGMLHPYLAHSKPSPQMNYRSYNQGSQQPQLQPFSPFDGPANREGLGPDGALNLKELLNLGNRPVDAQHQRGVFCRHSNWLDY